MKVRFAEQPRQPLSKAIPPKNKKGRAVQDPRARHVISQGSDQMSSVCSFSQREKWLTKEFHSWFFSFR
jgi:hypothetical protein